MRKQKYGKLSIILYMTQLVSRRAKVFQFKSSAHSTIYTLQLFGIFLLVTMSLATTTSHKAKEINDNKQASETWNCTLKDC